MWVSPSFSAQTLWESLFCCKNKVQKHKDKDKKKFYTKNCDLLFKFPPQKNKFCWLKNEKVCNAMKNIPLVLNESQFKRRIF